MSQQQALPPCCHALAPGRKDAVKARFETELSKFAVPSKKAGVTRLAEELTQARAALKLDDTLACAGGSATFHDAVDVPAYAQKLASYLALVKGFTESQKAATTESTPAVSDGSATPGTALREPLIEDPNEAPAPADEPTTATDGNGDAENASRSKPSDCSGCLSGCQWRDALTGATFYALSARHEYVQTLLAGGMFLLAHARAKTEVLMAQQPRDLDETQLKLAYQLLLHAAGALEACLEAMQVAPRSIGADVADLSSSGPEPVVGVATATTTTDDSTAKPDEDAMRKWRQEQMKAQSEAPAPASALIVNAGDSSGQRLAPSATEDLELLSRVPDLANGHFPQLLAWVALAEAQELVIQRGVSRELVDYSLMAKLATDTASRYKECEAFARRSLPCATSAVAEKTQLFCAFKTPYYLSLATYFQGAACMQKENARDCVQALANFKKAATLFERAVPHKKAYEAKLASNRDEKARVELLSAVFLRSQQVIDRDLDIVTHRNDTVYYESVPEPEALCEPLSLVKATAFPAVNISDLWRDDQVAHCLVPTAPGAAAPQGGIGNHKAGQPREGCCGSCVIL